MSAFWRAMIAGLVLVGLLCLPNPAAAQLGKLKDKVKDKVEKKADDKVDEKIDETLEGEPEEEEETTEAESTETSEETEGEESGTPAQPSAAAKLKPGEGAWLNYDFIPGDKILYYEDFEKSPVGDFPERLEFGKGNMEVAEWQGSRYLRISTHADFDIPLPKVLPETFTIEFDLYLPEGILQVYGFDPNENTPFEHSLVEFRLGEGSVRGEGGGEVTTSTDEGVWDGLVHCRLMGYKKYLKVYANEKRLANVPNADFIHSDKVHINVYNSWEAGILIDNIRIAEGGKKILYDQLTAEGRVATQGIYFDSGSDRIRPESTPTLKEIGTMLQEHADLKLMIEGHTDSQGDDAFNLTLSDKRAAAVKVYLVDTYKIDAARLQTKGFGETKPVDSNDTPEGRQNNRRVELVKL